MNDILIIGSGVIGLSTARALSRYKASIRVIDAAYDVSEGCSKANSAIVHAGYDAEPGTLKARLNVRGSEMYPDLCRELDVPYRRNGALILAFSEDDRGTIEKLYQQGITNGVKELRIIEREEILQLEPQTNPEVVCALLVPTSAITSPYEVCYAMADHAAVNGVTFGFGECVESMSYEDGVWHVKTSAGEETARVVINCAGADSAKFHNQMSGKEEAKIVNRRGQYYILDHPDVLPFDHTMFQCPTKMGKGILVAPTVHGNVLLGPTAEDVDDPKDVSTTAEGLAQVVKACKLTWPNVSVRTAVTNFSGMRAHEVHGDFMVGKVCEHGYEAAGMESPGLSAAPAVGEMLEEIIAREENLEKKECWLPAPERPKPFNEMTDEERVEAIRKDPLYGKIICRCEVVTEAEIRAAIRRPVGATSVDGVKRRTRAGMGRCQGGFCSPRVVEILAEELNLPMTSICKGGPGSELLVGTIQEAMGKEAAGV